MKISHWLKATKGNNSRVQYVRLVA